MRLVMYDEIAARTSRSTSWPSATTSLTTSGQVHGRGVNHAIRDEFLGLDDLLVAVWVVAGERVAAEHQPLVEAVAGLHPVGDYRDGVLQCRVEQVPQRHDRTDDSAEFPECLIGLVLAGVVVQSAQQRHRGDPPGADRQRQPHQVGPVGLDGDINGCQVMYLSAPNRASMCC